MKRLRLIMIALLYVAVSCSGPLPSAPQSPGVGVLKVELTDAGVTKSPYNTVLDDEKAIKFANILIYDENGNLIASRHMPEGTNTASIECRTGRNTVVAIVNHTPSDQQAQKLSTLRSSVLSLSSWPDKSAGIPMSAAASCTIMENAETACPLVCTRHHTRVVLRSVTNTSESGFTLRNAFLSNVQTSIHLDGSEVDPSTLIDGIHPFINKQGRAAPYNEAAVIDGVNYIADLPGMTFRSIGYYLAKTGTFSPSIPLVFYCFRNSSTVAPNGYDATFPEQMTTLVLTADFGGKTYYYPVVLSASEGLLPNHTYTVDVSISGPGSSDPNLPIVKTTSGISATIVDWSPNINLDETI